MTDILKQIDQHIHRLQNPRYRLKIAMGTRGDMEMTASLMEFMREVVSVALQLVDQSREEGITDDKWNEFQAALEGLEEQFNLADEEPVTPPQQGRCY